MRESMVFALLAGDTALGNKLLYVVQTSAVTRAVQFYTRMENFLLVHACQSFAVMFVSGTSDKEWLVCLCLFTFAGCTSYCYR